MLVIGSCSPHIVSILFSTLDVFRFMWDFTSKELHATLEKIPILNPEFYIH